MGGYRKNSGIGKSGRYHGYFFQSSWELAWIIYQLDHNVLFKRNTKGFEYFFNGVSFKFYPDFQLGNSNEYVEIKGYEDDKTKVKLDSFPHKLTIIRKNEIHPFIEYAKSKYGNDYVKLYVGMV
jgi:hypothetical protein